MEIVGIIFILGFLLIFLVIIALISRSKWNETKELSKKLHGNCKTFEQLDVSIIRSSKFRSTGPISRKCDIAICKSGIAILPSNYSLILFGTFLPLILNRSNESHILIKTLSWGTIRIEQNSTGSPIQMKYEIDVSFNDTSTREELLKELNHWKETSELEHQQLSG